MGRKSADRLLSLTADADERLASLLGSQGLDPTAAGLRVAVERGGCAGLSYRFDLVGSPETDDLVRDRDGVNVFVDPAAVEYVEGAEIDHTRSVHGTGFRIDNPNANQQCGCGLSFR
ncbi:MULTISPECIES: HesB/IscA family protein [Halolamina]|uniref:Iron-sulfur cluster assembly protein n=1 Tax=Halolamina pelagica TaxID=699431 RepID=A0A1I5NKT6_9EURY|nr:MULTISPECIES: iron-sulfur cluster assembly accessory protein [Halolamina]NHX36368.1 iron-sulfur cluster assembly accessory protein [Halolamina sp. R1-12]SFP22394.1 iron-sulfur cluster assembly protein [Halolamina pelagica]